jgi:hypothetical protein
VLRDKKCVKLCGDAVRIWVEGLMSIIGKQQAGVVPRGQVGGAFTVPAGWEVFAASHLEHRAAGDQGRGARCAQHRQY